MSSRLFEHWQSGATCASKSPILRDLGAPLPKGSLSRTFEGYFGVPSQVRKVAGNRRTVSSFLQPKWTLEDSVRVVALLGG